MNIVFMGTPEYANVILEGLIEDSSCSVDLVLTQPDRPVGRKKVLTPPPVKVLAQENNIEVLQPDSLKGADIQEKIAEFKPDMIIVAAFGQLLPKEVLDIAPCINLHASILPEYRGASPIQQGLLNGDEYLGVTAMLMEEGLDTGDILGFRFVNREEVERLDIAMRNLAIEASKLTTTIVKNFNEINPIPQLNATASHCKKIQKSDGEVELKNALELYRKFCGFFGWPGIYLSSGLKLIDIEIADTNGENIEGDILDILDDSIVVACKRGSIKIKTLQPPSKPKMDVKSYILGKRINIGDSIL